MLENFNEKKLLKFRNVIQIYKYEQIFSFIFTKKGEALIFALNFTFAFLCIIMIMTIMTMLCNTVSTLDYQKSSSRALINQYNVTVVVL